MIHISRFIDKIKFLEAQQSKEFRCSIQEAKDLHGDITKLLLALEASKELNASAKQTPSGNIQLSGEN